MYRRYEPHRARAASRPGWSSRRGSLSCRCQGRVRLHKGEGNPTPLYLDTHHHVEGLTATGVAAAHAADLAVQGKHDVRYLRYWFDEATGKVFCLVEAPSPKAAHQVHREAHGLLADVLTEVREGV